MMGYVGRLELEKPMNKKSAPICCAVLRSVGLIMLLLASLSSLHAQKPSQEVLSDLTKRAMDQILMFQDYVSILGAGEEPLEIRERMVPTCVKLFTTDAIIEEQSKGSSYKREWSPERYFRALLVRGERTPIVIDFQVEEEVNADELEEVANPDGTFTYRGTMVFRQYYCKIDEDAAPANAEDFSVKCSYEDTTDKEVTIELERIRNDGLGWHWATRIAGIKVIRVF